LRIPLFHGFVLPTRSVDDSTYIYVYGTLRCVPGLPVFRYRFPIPLHYYLCVLPFHFLPRSLLFIVNTLPSFLRFIHCSLFVHHTTYHTLPFTVLPFHLPTCSILLLISSILPFSVPFIVHSHSYHSEFLISTFILVHFHPTPFWNWSLSVLPFLLLHLGLTYIPFHSLFPFIHFLDVPTFIGMAISFLFV